MRFVAELLGISLILLGAYFGGHDIYDRWVNGPKKQRKSRKDT